MQTPMDSFYVVFCRNSIRGLKNILSKTIKNIIRGIDMGILDEVKSVAKIVRQITLLNSV